jgi:EAL domain-containing protein (putative c-di-GMP-specific phosphodiesterase class I)
VVRSLVEIASGLGRRTIAEYVENEETLEMLRDYGVDFVQGFHIGHPSPFLGARTRSETYLSAPDAG